MSCPWTRCPGDDDQVPRDHQSGPAPCSLLLIIAAEAATGILCSIGAFRMLGAIRNGAASSNHAKNPAVIGLTLGSVIWLGGFMAIGGEWFGMWMSGQWNGVESVFRFAALILIVLLYVTIPDREPGGTLSPPERP